MTIKTIDSELQRCLIAWRTYERDLIKAGLPGPLKVTAVGIKVADLQAYNQFHDYALPLCQQVHHAWVDGRYLGTYVLKEALTADNIRIIKVLQRRPGRDDPLGLEHIDLLIKDIQQAEKVLKDTKANWEAESNDVHSWLSVRFGEVLEYEAKFVDHLVLDAAIKEFEAVKKLI